MDYFPLHTVETESNNGHLQRIWQQYLRDTETVSPPASVPPVVIAEGGGESGECLRQILKSSVVSSGP